MLKKIFEEVYHYLDYELGLRGAKFLDIDDLSKISINHLDYLDAIWSLGRPTLSELAEKLNYTKPSVTIMVNKLIKEGFVKKVQSEEDRRVYFIEFTDIGRELVEIQLNNYREFASRLESVLEKQEIELLEQILSKGLKAIKQ